MKVEIECPDCEGTGLVTRAVVALETIALSLVGIEAQLALRPLYEDNDNRVLRVEVTNTVETQVTNTVETHEDTSDWRPR